MSQRKHHLWNSASGKMQWCFANNKWRIVARTHSLVKGRNCCIELSSGKCVWVTLARWANSDCSQFSGSGFVQWFRPALDTQLAQRTSKPSRNVSILFKSGLFLLSWFWCPCKRLSQNLCWRVCISMNRALCK